MVDCNDLPSAGTRRDFRSGPAPWASARCSPALPWRGRLRRCDLAEMDATALAERSARRIHRQRPGRRTHRPRGSRLPDLNCFSEEALRARARSERSHSTSPRPSRACRSCSRTKRTLPGRACISVRGSTRSHRSPGRTARWPRQSARRFNAFARTTMSEFGAATPSKTLAYRDHAQPVGARPYAGRLVGRIGGRRSPPASCRWPMADGASSISHSGELTGSAGLQAVARARARCAGPLAQLDLTEPQRRLARRYATPPIFLAAVRNPPGGIYPPVGRVEGRRPGGCASGC